MSRYKASEITLVGLFAALASLPAIVIHIGAGAIVPPSIVPLVVMLAGGILGPRLGSLSMFVYFLLGIIGFPVFEKPPFGGIAYVVQPTFGFLIGYVVAPYVVGTILRLKENRSQLLYIVAMLAGTITLYVFGLPYLYFILNFYLGSSVNISQLFIIGVVPFIVIDSVKLLVAAFLAKAVTERSGAVFR
ncbi:MAG TPA: biotin transporter BioY [Clostridia bacterium]|nr:biotin transporter BioY [Clostridia bacterium]